MFDSISNFFLDGLDSQDDTEKEKEESSSRASTSHAAIASKGPDPQCAGKGLVHADDDRCKSGAKVQVAFSFVMENWAKGLMGKVGKLVDRSPCTNGTWRVKFPGVPQLVECSVGLMGRHHLVYAEEDVFADEDGSIQLR